MEKNNFETGNQNNQNQNNGNFNPMNQNNQNRNNGNFNPMNQNNQNRNNGNFNPMNPNSQNRNNGNFNPMNQNNQNRNNGNFNPMNQNNQNRNNGNFNPMNQNNQNRNNGNFNPMNQNNQNQNYNNMNQNQNSYNHNSSNYNNMNPNQNNQNYNPNMNQNNNFNNQKSFLDSILEKDNPQNKLFLKLMFWISTVVFGLVAWITIKGIALYMQFMDLQKSGLISNISAYFSSEMPAPLKAFLGKSATTSLEVLSIRNTLKYIFIALFVLLILIFLKLRKTNNLFKFKNINYLSVIIFCIAGIAEIKYTDFIDKLTGSLANLGMGDLGASADIFNTVPDIFMIKTCFIVLLVFSLIAVVTNFFLIFRNKKFEMQDIQREFRTMKNKVMKNNNNYYNQNNNNNNNNENWNNNTNNDYNNQNYR